MLLQQPVPPVSFLTWLWKERDNRLLLVLAGVAIIIHFAWIKILYPYPNFMPPDSYAYLEAASKNLTVDIWPIGYSKFLRFISCFSNNHFSLVLLQYLLLQLSILYFIFSIGFFMYYNKWLLAILILVNTGNPLIGHISNFVSSDALFASLSILWLTQLIWILNKPTNRLLWIHAIVVLFAIMTRHSSIYYPFISAIVIFFSPLNLKNRIWGTVRLALFLLWFIGYNQYYYKKESGRVQYSAFAGWQLASNALYGYAYSQPDSPRSLPIKFRKLQEVVNKHMDSLKKVRIRPDREVALYYLWDRHSPLKEYERIKWKEDTSKSPFKSWAGMGPLYKEYGLLMMKKHPKEFAQYYLGPNFIKYYLPLSKFMGYYNLGNATVEKPAVAWFGWKNNKLPNLKNNKVITITSYFDLLLAFINFAFAINFLAVLIMTGMRKSFAYNHGIVWLIGSIWFLNMLFSIFSAPIELRYQIFPMILTLTFAITFVGFIINIGKRLQIADSERYPQLFIS